jgi:hypothetical protein
MRIDLGAGASDIATIRRSSSLSLAMSNTTMETFSQGGNCFDCHSDATGNMLGTSPGTDGFSGGLSLGADPAFVSVAGAFSSESLPRT